MKKTFFLYPLGLAALSVAFGCQEKAELPVSEYGEIRGALPVVENLPESFELPAAVEEDGCVMRKNIIADTRRQLEESQEKDAARLAKRNSAEGAK